MQQLYTAHLLDLLGTNLGKVGPRTNMHTGTIILFVCNCPLLPPVLLQGDVKKLLAPTDYDGENQARLPCVMCSLQTALQAAFRFASSAANFEHARTCIYIRSLLGIYFSMFAHGPWYMVRACRTSTWYVLRVDS